MVAAADLLDEEGIDLEKKEVMNLMLEKSTFLKVQVFIKERGGRSINCKTSCRAEISSSIQLEMSSPYRAWTSQSNTPWTFPNTPSSSCQNMKSSLASPRRISYSDSCWRGYLGRSSGYLS